MRRFIRIAFDVCLGYAICNIQVIHSGLKLNCTHQLLVYVDDDNILVGRLHNIKKISEALLVTTKKIGLEINVHNFKYMFMPRDQNAGRSQNKYFENSTSDSL